MRARVQRPTKMSAPNVIPAKAGIQYAYCASLSAARSSSSLKPRGNAATGAPFAGGVLDSRLRGNDGSIHTNKKDTLVNKHQKVRIKRTPKE